MPGNSGSGDATHKMPGVAGRVVDWALEVPDFAMRSIVLSAHSSDGRDHGLFCVPTLRFGLSGHAGSLARQGYRTVRLHGVSPVRAFMDRPVWLFFLEACHAPKVEIAAGAERRLAHEYDGAQQRGEVKRNGGDRVSIVSKKNNAAKKITEVGTPSRAPRD